MKKRKTALYYWISALIDPFRLSTGLYMYIMIIRGDSANILPKNLLGIKNTSLFWLDAHYSDGITAKGNVETPIMQELQSILKYSDLNHIILIDDARLFYRQNNYPTLNELRKFINSKYPDLIVLIKYDIIRIRKKSFIS